MARMATHALHVIDTKAAQAVLSDGSNAHVSLHTGAEWQALLAEYTSYPAQVPEQGRVQDVGCCAPHLASSADRGPRAAVGEGAKRAPAQAARQKSSALVARRLWAVSWVFIPSMGSAPQRACDSCAVPFSRE
jgi:hypothetical protein